MLQTSDDPDSPWRLVKGTNLGFLTDKKTGARFDYLTVKFYDDDGERILNLDEEVEVGLVRPPTWPDDMEPPDWPRRQPT